MAKGLGGEHRRSRSDTSDRANGRMCTGWIKSTAGNYRYFKPSNGIMYVGLNKIKFILLLFFKDHQVSVIRKDFGTVGGKKYYFDPSNGKAKIGWLDTGR